MRKCFIIIIFFLPLFLFSSCYRYSFDYKELLNSNNYSELYEVSSNNLRNKMTEDSLYYKTVACYYLDRNEECIKLANLYLSMYTDNRTNVLKMMLYKGSHEKAYEAGNELYVQNNLSPNDKIQYFKVITSLNKTEETRYLINEIEDILPPYDYALAVIQGENSNATILKALKKLYEDEGTSAHYLMLVKNALDLFYNREYTEITNQFLATTFNGNPQYAQIIGDYFYNIKDYEQAISYWVYTKEMYPTAFDVRMKMIRGLQSQT